MDKNLIGITDKDLMIYLSCRGLKIIDYKKDIKRNRSIVYFINNDELSDALLDYANRDGDINIGDFLASEKRINNLLYFNKSS